MSRCALPSQWATGEPAMPGEPMGSTASGMRSVPMPAVRRPNLRFEEVAERGASSEPLPQLVQQRLCLLQIWRLEALGEPAIDRSEEVAGFGATALVAA